MQCLVKNVITQVHARREEKVKMTGRDEGKRTRTLTDFNFVKKKFDEEQEEND